MKKQSLCLLVALLLLVTFSSQAQNAINLDGTNDWISTNQPSITGNVSRTIECWMKVPTTASTTQHVMVDMGALSPNGSRFTLNIINGNKIRIEIGGNGFNGVTNVNDNVWHHIAVTYNPANATGTKAKLYLDGTLEAQADFTVTMSVTAGNIRVGYRVDNLNSFVGSIDEVRVWTVERTATQINADKNVQYCNLPAGLIAFYKFNEGVAGGTNTAITTVDNWANPAYNGTLTNFAMTGSTSNLVSGAPVTSMAVTTSTINPVTCGPYTSPANHLYTSTGVYHDTLANSNGCDSVITINLTVGSIPVAPGTITGNNSVCPNSAQNYSVTTVSNATSYIWTLPSGWTGSSTTNSIAAVPGTTGGVVTVAAVNTCGTSAVSSLAVNIAGQAPPQPGNVAGGTSVCPGSSQTYTVAAIPNVLSYNWTLPTGWSGTSATNTITVTTGTAGGNITVNANNGCGSSNPTSLPVVVLQVVVPAVSISTAATTICAGSVAIFSSVAVNGGASPNYQWKLNGTPTGLNLPTFTSTTLSNGDVVSLTMTSAAACPTPPTTNSNQLSMTVQPNTVPGINVNASTPWQICNGTSVVFTTNITGGGTAPQYQWMRNGTAVGSNASVYSTPGVNNGDTIYCVLTTNGTCPVAPTSTSNKLGFEVTSVITPHVTVTASPGNVIMPGQAVIFTATVTGGGSSPLYQWKKNGLAILGETNASYMTATLENQDQISVQLVSSATCAFPVSVASAPISVRIGIAGIGQVGNSGTWSLNLYPNPNKGQFQLSGNWPVFNNDEPVRISIADFTGRVIYQSECGKPLAGEALTVTLPADVADGVYFVRLQNGNAAAAQRFLIQQRQ